MSAQARARKVPNLIPSNPDYDSRVRESFGRQAFMDLIGACVEDVSPGRCVLRLPHKPALEQHEGRFHAGAIATLADTAAGYAAFSLAPAEASILTVEFKINYLIGALGDHLVAEGDAIRAGQSLTVCEARVYCESAGQRELCSVVLETLIYLPGRADSQDVSRPATQRRATYQPDQSRAAVNPATDAFADNVAGVLAAQPFASVLGLQLEYIEPGYSVCRVPHRADLTQQHGFFHGGMVATIADMAMGTAAGSLAPKGIIPQTAEFKLNLMAPGDGRSLKAYGYVVRPGRTLSICRADVATVNADGAERLCASALGTLVPQAS